jgi:hypothetical protein
MTKPLNGVYRVKVYNTSGEPYIFHAHMLRYLLPPFHNLMAHLN